MTKSFETTVEPKSFHPASLLVAPVLTLLILLSACAVHVTFKGLRPVYPAYPEKYVWGHGSPYEKLAQEVDSLQPTLKWESFPRQRHITTDESELPGRISNVTYELQIFKSSSEVVYERKGLATPQHRVETALQPSSRYLWSVRSQFDLDGRPTVTDWSDMTVDVKSLHFIPRKWPYAFRTPEAKK